MNWFKRWIKPGNERISHLPARLSTHSSALHADEFCPELYGLFREALNALPGMICIYQVDGPFLFLNQAAAAFLDLSADQVEGKTWDQFLEMLSPEQIRLCDQIRSMHPEDGSAEIVLEYAGKKHTYDFYYTCIQNEDRDDISITFLADISDSMNIQVDLNQRVHSAVTLLNALPVPVYYKDQQGVYRGANKAFHEATGVSPEKLIGKTVDDMWSTSNAQKYYQMDNALFQKPGEQYYQHVIRYADGLDHDVIFHKATYEDIHGEICGIIGAMLDITERVQAEKKLVASEQKYRRLFNDSVLGAFISTADGQLRDVNPAFVHMLGYESPAELLDDTQADALHLYANPSDRQAIITRILNDQKPVDIEVLHRRRDGTIFPAHLHVWKSTGELSENILLEGLMEDISERKQVEGALRESERRFRQLAENVQSAFWMGDPNRFLKGHVVYVNPILETIFGISADEIMESLEAWVSLLHPEDRDWVVNAYSQLIRDEGSDGVEYRIIHPQKGLRWIWASVFPIKDGTGRLEFIGGFAQDITERKQTENTIRMLNEDLEKRVQERTQELELANSDLRRFAQLAAGREIRMAELKKEIEKLRAQIAGDEQQ